MKYAQELARLVAEHELDQKHRDYSDNRKSEAYLREVLPIEKFMRACYEEGYRGYFWDALEMNSEAFTFRRREPQENIQISRHFRWDRHPIHTHSHFQLVYTFEGEPVIETEAESIRLHPGDFCIIAPGMPHHIVANSDDISVIKIYTRSTTFEQVFLRWLGENNFLSEFYRRVLYENETGRYLIFCTGGDSKMRELMLDMYSEFMQARPYANIIVEGRLTEYFCRLVRDFSGGVQISGDEGKSRNVSAVIKYIMDHHADVTLDSLSASVGYSKTYLCRLLMRTTGKTFTQILNAARVEAAAGLLEGTAMPVQEIAARVGYNSIEHFYRTFRESRGMTPREWRTKYRKK